MKRKQRITAALFLAAAGLGAAVGAVVTWLVRPGPKGPAPKPLAPEEAAADEMPHLYVPTDAHKSHEATAFLPPPRLKLGMVGMTRFVVAMGVFAIVSTAAGMIGMTHSTRSQNRAEAMALTGGDPYRGQAAIDTYGCASCHTIPGVPGATAQVGPPLTQIGARAYVGGVMANTPDNMIHWILDPPHVDPQTAMPNLHVTEADARDIACYLYTLR